MKIDLGNVDNVELLNRICEVYGFNQKVQLANHFDIAASSLSNRYRRGPISYDFAVFCSLETGANINWLITGQGPKFSGEPAQSLSTDTIGIPYSTLSDGEIHENGTITVSNSLFGKPIINPMSIHHGNQTYFIERNTSLSDGSWLIDIDGAISIRELTVLPAKKLHVAGGKIPFECATDEIKTIGRVVGIYSEGH
jgi:hypothetical protein